MLAASVSSPEEQRQLRQALALIESPALSLLLAGRPRPFTALDLAARERVLRSLSASRVGLLRMAYQSFKRLGLFLYYARSDEKLPDNPNWPDIGYAPAAPEPCPTTRPIKPLAITTDTTLDADAVVIGSGAGGGVVAAALAAAGRHVVVLEKGGYYCEADFDGREAPAFRNLYEKMGTLTTSDLGMNVLAGSTLGGGTTVNWTTSLRTPEFVLAEWERDYGIADATGPEWQASLDAVSARIHVHEAETVPNAQNRLLCSGCEQLGYHW